MRLTGPVAIDDEEFASIKENAVRNGAITVAIVFFILWLALRSGQLIVAVFINLLVGLAVTAALGLMMLGAFNIISVYFAVLFVGIGVDFAIQFSVRYRAERHDWAISDGIRSAGSRVALPLALAGLRPRPGSSRFFRPTIGACRNSGSSPAGDAGRLSDEHDAASGADQAREPAGRAGSPRLFFPRACRRISRKAQDADHRRDVGRRACVSPALYWLRFDFNPVNLHNPNSEAISTYLELQKDRSTGANAAQALAPSLEQADAIAARTDQAA